VTTFDLVDETPSTLALSELLVRHGATPAPKGDLLVVDASSIERARERLHRLTGAERSRTLLVGHSGSLEGGRPPAPDSLAGVLEEYAPLGALASAAQPWRAEFAGFIGKRSLSDALGTSCFKRYMSAHYGPYIDCAGPDAGAFVLRYLRAAVGEAAVPGDAYVSYLKAQDRRACAQSLDDMLVAVGRGDEAVLWRAWCAGESRAKLASGAWRDRAVHLGMSPPRSAAIGDLWFDVCEVSLMVHAGRAWLGTQPTARWQMRGFLDVAERAPRAVQVRPPYTALDPKRLYDSADGPVSNLTTGEATLYAWWFGKTVPHLFDWQSAAEHLPREQVKALWGTSEKEWTSMKLANDEAARVFVTPATIDEDPSEIAEDDARASSMIAGEYTHLPLLGFRTSVLVQSGLLQTVSSWHVLVEDVRLSSLLDRSSFR
jgi:hypothetical protein